MQIAILFVFFDTHWERTAERMTEAVSGSVALAIDLNEGAQTPDAKGQAALRVRESTGLRLTFRQGETTSPPLPPRLLEPIDQRFVDALKRSLGNRPFNFDARRGDGLVGIEVPVRDGVLEITIDRWRTVPTRGYQFLMAVIAATVLLMTVSILFIRNQVRPIERLARAAEAFGRGRELPGFKPRGALEVRAAAAAVIEMRDRITKHIEQRTALLASVSHDLRTPLTRLRLQLALMPPSDDVQAIKGDLDDMEHTLDEYLLFASGASTDEPENTDVSLLVQQVVDDAERLSPGLPSRISLSIEPGIHAAIRAASIRRALSNLIENALTHASQLVVTARKNQDDVALIVDDDGPGIPEEHHEDVFKPFTRLEPGRNRNRKGVGLGLAIARDIARTHGGDITLRSSPAGGLRAEMRLPL
jgi:two-component system, OmpR family, osmolarity sensor histidine kinase EnvZ